MFYKIDYKNKIIFGTTPKAGCIHVRSLYYFYTDLVPKDRKEFHSNMGLPNNINEYKILLFIRNPYKRIISGFIEKIVLGKIPILFDINVSDVTFEYFVDYFINNKILLFGNDPFNNHFNLQTTNIPDDIIIDKIYDIENIDYNYIDSLYEKKTNDVILHERGGHNILYDNIITEKFYNTPISILKSTQPYPFYEKFFNEEIQRKVYELYEKDFITFKNWGFNYQIKI